MIGKKHPFYIPLSAVLLLLATCFFIWVACSKSGTTPGTDLHVVSFSPASTVLDNREPVQLKFDKPIVSEAEVGKTLRQVPVAFSPKVKIEARWLDRQTLVLQPRENYSSATRYEVSLKSPIKERVPEKELKYYFVHDPIRLKGIVGMDASAAPKDPRFDLAFNLPVRAEDVVDACAIYRDKNGDKTRVVSKSKDDVNTRIALAPLNPLLQQNVYHIRCRNLKPANGNWALEKAEVTFTTYAAFAVEKFLPKEKVISPEAGKVQIRFATPVKRSEFEDYVVVRVNGKKISNRHWDRSGNGTVYKWDSYLEAVSKYEIRIRKGLADKYGQKLESQKKIQFETIDAPPAISVETGIVTVESGMDGYQVWTRNVPDMTVECARVPPNRIAKLIGSGDLKLYPWMGAHDDKIDWQMHRLRPKKETLQINKLKNQWNEHRISLPDICGGGESGGVYLTELTSDEVRQQKVDVGWGRYPFRALANVTDLGVMLKVGPASSMVWVTSLSTGKTVGGAKVSVYDLRGKRLFSGRTDSDGRVTVPGSKEMNHRKTVDPENEYYDYYNAQRFIAVVEAAGDTAVVDGDWNEGITLWNFSIKSDRSGGEKRIRGFIQSDRGIYKPGETVYFKALVREVSLKSPPKTPKGRAHVVIEDPYGTVLSDKNMPISRFGSLNFKLALSSQARLGDYYVKITVAEQTFRERFSVEEFRPVSFEIKKSFDNAEQLMGEKLKFAFTADYLFGAPVKNADVEWMVTRCQRPLAFSKYKRYSFTANRSYYWDWYYDNENGDDCTYISDNTATTDRKGRFGFSVKDDSETAGMVDYIARVTVTDETDQSVSKQVAIRAHATDVYLGVKPTQWVQSLKDGVAVDAVALDTKGASLTYQAKVTVERETWECESGPGYGYGCDRKMVASLTKDVTIDRGGSRIDLPVKKAGDYLITVAGTDSRGKKVKSTTWIWVTGRSYYPWWGDDANRMTLIPSKDKYAPGDTAVLIPKADTEGSTLLVTVERDGIMDSFVVAGKPSGEGIEVPIRDNYAPNVYVSVIVMKPRTGDTGDTVDTGDTGDTGDDDQNRPIFAMGIVELNVSTAKKALQVQVETEKTDYEPGETVRGKIVLTSDGSPVVGEVAVSVADEGVLQLINYQTPNPMLKIYAPFGLGVDTSTNMLHLARYRNPVDESEEGADGGEDGGPRVRSKFVASAFWKPDLVTDANGEATFEFVAPDNLTAFRVMAVAADDAEKFGSSDRRIVVNKKLMLQPVLPRFFGSGDRSWVGAMVHNYSGGASEVKINWKLNGLWTKGSEETVSLADGESKRVQFYVQAGKQKKATIQMSAEMRSEKGSFSDAFEVSVPIRRNLAFSRETAFEGKTVDTGDVALQWPDDVVPKFSHVSVSVDRYGLGILSESLRYLVKYPYGCLEQTMSKLVPMFKVKDLATSMKMDELKGGKLKQFISFGVDKVLRHQHDNGQFSLWPDSTPSAHLTAYALWGLSEAEKAGIKVDKEALEKGVEALRRWAGSAGEPRDSGEAAEQAQAAFILAHYGKPDVGLNARLFEGRNMLPVYGKTYLLKAMMAAGDDVDLQKQLVVEILSATEKSSDGLIVREPGTYRSSLAHYMSSDTRTTAMVISALSQYDATLPEIGKLVAGLKGQRVDGGRWRNTQENVYGLIAIADFVRSQADSESQVTIVLDGNSWKSFNLKGSKVMRFTKQLAAIKKGTIRVESASPVEVSINLSLAKETDENPAVDKGFQVKRTYTNLETGKAVEKVKAGTLIKVRIEIQSEQTRDYVAVADPLPAGCEAVNTKLAVVNSTLSERTSSSYTWDYVELRDDQVNAFADFMKGDTKTIEYLLRATVPGTFKVPGTLVEEMYTPAHYGLSDEKEIKVYR